MGYRIRSDETVQKAVQRIAREQIDKGLAEIEDPDLGRHEAVHQVRKRCKKIRGLIRLVRPKFKPYARENAWYRDSARPLSYVRDAQALLETFDDLTGHYEAQIDRDAFAPVRQALAERREKAAENDVGLPERLDEFLQRMHEARERLADWRVKGKGFDAVQGGLAKTYGRARKAMDAAFDDPTAENFHEWRKRAKYHWYHTRLLQHVWKGPMKQRRSAASALADCLGHDHDLSVLRATLLAEPGQFGDEETLQALLGLINQRQIELRLKSTPLGERLFAEAPNRFAKRLRAYWGAWRREHKTEPKTTHEPGLATA